MEPLRATPEERREIKRVVIHAITSLECELGKIVPALDVGQVLVSIGAAMLKGSNASETEFLDYARKAWAAQHSHGAVPFQ